MKLTGAEIVIKLLENQGIKRIAGIPGGFNLPLYDALYKSNIRHILARHEQAAGFMAQGEARLTGKAAVCFATSGPGATNLLTAIADAKMDSIPVVAITGQVPCSMIGTDAFQEVDTYGIYAPITKHNYLVRSVNELFTVIPEAFRIAESGRPGPVLIDIPKDVQMASCEFESFPPPGEKDIPPVFTDTAAIAEAAELIKYAEKPVLYAGGGILHADACHELLELSEKNNIPVTVTLMGLGAIPYNHPLFIGMLGMHAARHTNYILDEADLIIAIGVRFDDRATGRIDKFCPGAKVIHIDADPAEINKIRRVQLPIAGDAKEVLKALIPVIPENTRNEWSERVCRIRNEYASFMQERDNMLHPIQIIRRIGEMVSDDTPVATDVGQHQMWVAASYPFKKPRTLLTSGGAGTMGFGLPAAIGAAIAGAGKRVVCFSGDGSILMNIQELDTLAEENLNVTVFVMNNHSLGLVRQQQELFYQKNYMASRFRNKPRFSEIAKGFGIRGLVLDDAGNAEEILKQSLSGNGPCLVEVRINPDENVLPMVPPGASNLDMIC